MFRMFRKLMIFVAAITALLAVAAVLIPFLISAETYRGQLQERLSALAGREVRIAGEMRLLIVPDIALEARGVSIANPAGFEKEPMAEIGKLSLAVALVPLLKGELDIRELALDSPKINLRRNIRGEGNWEFASVQAREKEKERMPPPFPAAAADKESSPISVDIRSVEIYNGAVTWRDEAAKNFYRLEQTDLSLARAGRRIMLTGKAAMDGNAVELKAELDAPDALPEKKKSGLKLRAALGDAEAEFDGHLALPFALEGRLALNVPSVNRLSQQLTGRAALDSETTGALKCEGQARITADMASVNDAEIQFDAIHAAGKIAADYGGRTPHLSADLALDELDLNPYMPEDGENGESGSAGGAAPAASGGWSREPLDFSALKGWQADIAVSLKKLVARRVLIEDLDAGLLLEQGALTANVRRMNLYGGKGSGAISLDAGRGVPEMNIQAALRQVKLEPLLADALGEERLSGAGDLDFSLEGYGHTQYDMVSSLRGGGSFRLADGSINGVNFAQMLRNVKSAFAATDTAERSTDFAELSGSVTVDGGIVRNQDLELKAPAVRMGGEGQANLVTRTVRYRVTPKFVATGKGQGDAEQERRGITVPVIVEGPFDDLSFRPDLTGMIEEGIKNPEAIKESAEGVKERLRQLKQLDSGEKKRLLKDAILPSIR